MLNELKSLIIKPSLYHHSYSHSVCDDTVPNEFSVLCWNVHKNNDTFSFSNYIEEFSKKKPVDFYLFQEADFKHNTELNLPSLTFNAAANLEKGPAFYGVLTASKCKTTYSKPFLSHGKELVFGPRKSLLLTRHAFEDDSPLLILNLHAINFRENRHYYKEIDNISHIIVEYDGAMIIAGDFNSWSDGRQAIVRHFADALAADSVQFSVDLRTTFFEHVLDHIFYRGLEPVEAVVEQVTTSDHNPMRVTFRLAGDLFAWSTSGE